MKPNQKLSQKDGTQVALFPLENLRITQGVDNVYTGDMLADQFDIHIEIDGFGSQEEYIKT